MKYSFTGLKSKVLSLDKKQRLLLGAAGIIGLASLSATGAWALPGVVGSMTKTATVNDKKPEATVMMQDIDATADKTVASDAKPAVTAVSDPSNQAMPSTPVSPQTPTQTATTPSNPYGQKSIAPADEIVNGLGPDKYSRTPPADCTGFVNTDPTSKRYSKLPLTLSATDITLSRQYDDKVYITASSPHGLAITEVMKRGESPSCSSPFFPIVEVADYDMANPAASQTFYIQSSGAAAGTYTLTLRADAGRILYYATLTIHIVDRNY